MSGIVRPSELLMSKLLPGTLMTGKWKVISKVSKSIGGSGGTFSVCYTAEHEDGTKGFVKATDIGLLTKFTSGLDQFERLALAVNEQRFERRILDICRGNNMDRVVTALDYGQLEITDTGIRELVFFIVFEPAIGDVRNSAIAKDVVSPSWFLKALHNISVAVQQLHRQSIAHNDIKPSNVLVFDKELQKLADLGRATADGIPGPWDEYDCVGDMGYIAPELWYPVTQKAVASRVAFDSRAPSDIYLLGSLAYFFLSGSALTGQFQSHLRPEHRPGNWKGDYHSVLPYLIDAHDEAMAELEPAIRQGWAPEQHKLLLTLVPLIRGLTFPDPERRGDPSVQNGGSRYSLQRVVSLFDRYAKEAAHP